MMTTGQLNDNCEAVTVVLSAEVVYALETVSDRSALIERAIRRGATLAAWQPRRQASEAQC